MNFILLLIKEHWKTTSRSPLGDLGKRGRLHSHSFREHQKLALLRFQKAGVNSLRAGTEKGGGVQKFPAISLQLRLSSTGTQIPSAADDLGVLFSNRAYLHRASFLSNVNTELGASQGCSGVGRSLVKVVADVKFCIHGYIQA